MYSIHNLDELVNITYTRRVIIVNNRGETLSNQYSLNKYVK